MEPNEALAELLTLSSQIVDVAILGGSGFVLASSGTPERGEELARIAAELLAAAADVRPGGDIARIEVGLEGGSVFVVTEGGRSAVARTVPEPTAGLVVYDLRTALHRLDEASRRSRPGSGSVVPRMRKLLALAVIGGIVYWFLNRGGSDGGQSATIGYADGSAVSLEQGTPELDRLVQIASAALLP